MPTKNLIIDGHGAQLTSSFNFQRAQGNECTLYSYVRNGIPIPANQSDNIIAKIISGNFSSEIATPTASRIGGTQVADRVLHAIGVNSGTPEWDNDGLFPGATKSTIVVNGINVDELSSGNNVYVRLPFGATQTVNLSSLISHYSTGQYNIFWTVCR
ncbi:putative adhesin [Marinoscillum sp.]|uniref:putative adhesin n=1 Tax=Marinoscillum sp. TaxID=2024838 RepID=UPI003BABB3F2